MKVQERLLAATITAMLLSVPLAEAKDAVPNLGGGLPHHILRFVQRDPRRLRGIFRES